jgi:hypothetical protein
MDIINNWKFINAKANITLSVMDLKYGILIIKLIMVLKIKMFFSRLIVMEKESFSVNKILPFGKPKILSKEMPHLI